MDNAAFLHFFFLSATQYYISGRYAVLANLVLIAGNLMHHAVEMYLKGALSKIFTPEELKKKFGHNLPKLWHAFKKQVKDPRLDPFDTLIMSLDKFEEIRYPDAILEKVKQVGSEPGAPPGWQASISIGHRVQDAPTGQPSRTGSHYELYVGEIDNLVVRIFATMSVPQTPISPYSMPVHAKTYKRQIPTTGLANKRCVLSPPVGPDWGSKDPTGRTFRTPLEPLDSILVVF
jgi:hypothetical protein